MARPSETTTGRQRPVLRLHKPEMLTMTLTLVGISYLAEAMAFLGCVQAVAGVLGLVRFRRRALRSSRVETDRTAKAPGVTVMKPLHGDEPLPEEALASFCKQDYPEYEIVFGVQSAADPAVAVVRQLQARFPYVDIGLVINGRHHGVNRKIGNLINMLPKARYDLLVLSDSDIHVRPNYLREVVRAFDEPGAGLVTALYYGRPANNALACRFASEQINHIFAPGVLLSRWLGRQDRLGATMALTRSTLTCIGGFRALSDHVADDAMLGRLVREAGLSVVLAGSIATTTVGERTVREVFAHELRWGRTVRSVESVGYAASSLQLSLFWALVGVACAPCDSFGWWSLMGTWLVRMLAGRAIDDQLGIGPSFPALLLPLRDCLSATVMVASFAGRRVTWRGRTLHVTSHLPVVLPSTVSELAIAESALTHPIIRR
jgi:ceramide glucosyltransferase